ncbi:Mediator of RNA polymerase II transcription subunit 14 [Pseudozyma hubeiensis]|nr:Mediator of RNA polymerase II transcription subunit 14 [Pseudozyma hubeiensis]
MASNGNVHYRAASPSAAVDRNKQMATSPHKLMIGVPPAATPDLSSVSNGVHDSRQSNGVANSTTAVAAADVKGKQKEIDPIEAIPLAQLEQELPLEEADLVSLAALVERLANFGYESLQNLAETLPSLPSSSKRAKIFNTALDVRKQFIKLLVLARWSKDVTDLNKSRNIIALLSEQQWQHEDVFAGLTDIRKILPNARMRNADLPTAIDVLQTGTYRRLPASIKDMAVAPKPFTDQQALAIVTRLEDALRTRMACRELVPALLSNYSIHDGKVHFRVPGLFDAQLAASGAGQDGTVDHPSDEPTLPSPDDRWWLLDLSFDFTPTGSCAESSRKSFPRKPKRAFRERLRVWGDQELAPRPQSESTDESKSVPLETGATEIKVGADAQDAVEQATALSEVKDSDNPKDMDKDELATAKLSVERDAPLSRLFAFLQERSLHYQMDVLQHQAFELCRLNWGTNLRIETGERPRRLTVYYWTQAQGAAGAKRRAEGPAAGGSVQITIVDLPDQPGAKKVLAALFDEEDEQSSKANELASLITVKRRGLQVTWNAEKSILADSETEDLAVSSNSLDLESLLSLVIKRHTLALLRNLQRRILVRDHPVSRLLRPEDCTLSEEHSQRQGDEFCTATEMTSFSFLQIALQGSHRQRGAQLKQRSTSSVPALRLSVDPVTGRLLLDSETTRSRLDQDTPSLSRQAAGFTASILTTRATYSHLAEASDRINESIEAVFDVLYKLEVFARVEEWERMSSHLGLRAVRKLALRPQDLAKFGPSVSTSPEAVPRLFIPLRSSFPGYFLALQPSELAGVGIALVYVAQTVDPTGVPSLALQSIEWLDRSKIATAASEAGRDSDTDAGTMDGEAGRKRKGAPSISARQSDPDLVQKNLTTEELADVHSYCIALVSYFRVEQQLRLRGIPYLHVGSNTSRSSPPAKLQKRRRSADRAGPAAEARDDGLFDDDGNLDAAAALHEKADVAPAHSDDEASQGAEGNGVAALVPSLCLRAADLLGPAKAHLAKPNVSLRVRNWNDSDRFCVQMRIKLRMKSRRFGSLHEVVSFAPTVDQHSSSALTWIDFDSETSLLTLSTRDLDNCILTLYTQWERAMRMVLITREVLNASRAWQQRALRSRISCKKPAERVELQYFDFDSVIFSYGSAVVDGSECRLLVRVRWQDAKMEIQPFTNMTTTQMGGYTLEFGSIPNAELDAFDRDAARSAEGSTSKWFDDAHASANPHNAMAFELRRTVNVAARSAAIHAVVQPQSERMVWKGFFQLLQDTLPLARDMAPLVERCLTDAEVPEVEIKGATWFRLRFQDRFAVDLRMATRSRLIVSDASRPLFRSEMQKQDGDAVSPNAGADAETGLFAGTELLSSLLAGKSAVAKAAEGEDLKVPQKPRISAAVSNEVTLTGRQFQPIPNIERVLRKVQAGIQAASSSTGAAAVWDLRRALLISLGPAPPSILAGQQSSAKGGSDGVLSNLISSLVECVSAEIGSGSSGGSQL